MVLPSGFALPPLPYLAVLVAALAGVGWALAREDPAVTATTVVAFAPWMVLGSTLYVCYQLAVFPAAVAPFFGSPAVYLSTAVVGGLTWLAARRTDAPLRVLAGVGLVLTSIPVAVAVRIGAQNDTLGVAWPLAGGVIAVVVAAVVWRCFARVRPGDARTAGRAGILVVFAHALDGVSTAVGVDVLGFGEQTPASRFVMEAAAALPTASYLGVGWLFVAVKLLVSALVVVLLADYVREDPRAGNLLFAFVAAVGLGPGAHNLLLFSVTTPAGF